MVKLNSFEFINKLNFRRSTIVLCALPVGRVWGGAPASDKMEAFGAIAYQYFKSTAMILDMNRSLQCHSGPQIQL